MSHECFVITHGFTYAALKVKKSLGWKISAQRRGILSNAVNMDCNLSSSETPRGKPRGIFSAT
jgi:hypothetical protein